MAHKRPGPVLGGEGFPPGVELQQGVVLIKRLVCHLAAAHGHREQQTVQPRLDARAELIAGSVDERRFDIGIAVNQPEGIQHHHLGALGFQGFLDIVVAGPDGLAPAVGHIAGKALLLVDLQRGDGGIGMAAAHIQHINGIPGLVVQAPEGAGFFGEHRVGVPEQQRRQQTERRQAGGQTQRPGQIAQHGRPPFRTGNR